MGYFTAQDMPERSGASDVDIQRLWEYVRQLKDEMEFAINNAVKGGRQGE